MWHPNRPPITVSLSHQCFSPSLSPSLPLSLNFFFGLFSLVFRLGHFYCSVFQLTDSFLCPPLHSALELIHPLSSVFQLLYLPVLTFPFGRFFLCWNFVSLLRLSVSSFATGVLTIAYSSIFIVLNISNVSVIFVASIVFCILFDIFLVLDKWYLTEAQTFV